MESTWERRGPTPDLRRTARIVEGIEAAAWADCFDAVAETDLETATGRIADATVVRMGKLHSGLFSKVIGLGLERRATVDTVREILAWYGDAGIGEIWFQPSPAAEPDGLLPLLRTQGIVPIERKWGKFVRDAGNPAEARTDLDIREIGAEDAVDFANCVLEGFALSGFLNPWLEAIPGREGWHVYVAYDNGEPAACGALFRRDGAGFIGFDATRPAFRRRGAQGALMARRIADAGRLDIHILTAETGVDEEGPGPSWRNIVRAGFELLYVRPNCAPKGIETANRG